MVSKAAQAPSQQSSWLFVANALQQRVNQIAIPAALLLLMMQIEGAEGRDVSCTEQCRRAYFLGSWTGIANIACEGVCAFPGGRAVVMAAEVARTFIQLINN